MFFFFFFHHRLYWHLYTWVLNECKSLFLKGHIESLRKERDMLKLVESRLTQEKETILSQQQSQNVLLSNLQTIQVHVLLILWTEAMLYNFLILILAAFPPAGHSWKVGDWYAPASYQSVGKAGTRDLPAAKEAGTRGGAAPPPQQKSGCKH